MTNRYKHYYFEIEKHLKRLWELERGKRGPGYIRSKKTHKTAIEGYTTRLKRLGREAIIIRIKGTTLQSLGKISIKKPIEIYFSNTIPEEVYLILEYDYKGVTMEDLEVIIPGEIKILNSKQQNQDF